MSYAPPITHVQQRPASPPSSSYTNKYKKPLDAPDVGEADSKIKNKSTRLSSHAAVANSGRHPVLEKSLGKRSYQLEFIMHKKQKVKDERCEVKVQKYVDNRQERAIPKSANAIAGHSSYIPFDVEAIDSEIIKQVYGSDQMHEAESTLKQTDSSAPGQQYCSNALIPHEIKTHIERHVDGAVASQLEALQSRMIKMEEKMQLFDDFHKSRKDGNEPKRTRYSPRNIKNRFFS
ncbi:hypothetical protein CTI12_AA204240 [Artemisia annua]|uniref:Uncharacterized protein n=1 Tax=Artemisia annua TaxID=35608 RepID=A0A2U1P1G8_ARTAN|nr:hypothetical protein CTI12_AA204240 [Artemisia annua]